MVALSTAMATGLNDLIGVNRDVGTVQGRLNSGQKITSYADSPSLFIKAQTYRDKADALEDVNGKISQGVKNLDTVNKAMNTMYDNLNGALATLKDARAKSVNVVTQVRTFGGVGTGITMTRATVPAATLATGAQATLTDGERSTARGNSLVGVSADIQKANQFQVGDTFAVTMTDSNTGSTSTRWFRATAAGNVTPGLAVNRVGTTVTAAGTASDASNPAATADGTTEIQAINFNTLGDLQDALGRAFGTNDLQVGITATKTAQGSGASGNDTFTLGLSLTTALATQSVSFTQVYNNDTQATGTAANPANITSDQTLDASGRPITRGASFDFSSLFGSFANPSSGAALAQQATQGVTSNIVGQNTALTSASKTLTSYTYAPTANAAGALQSALETRRQASDTFKAALYNFQNMVNDAALPGFANLLKGETLSIDLNETGEVRQTIKLGAVDARTLGFGYAVTSDGTVTTGFTNSDFNNDTDLDTAIGRTTTALTTLRIRQNAIGAQTNMLQSRLDYNKLNVDNLKTGANDITAADSAEEAANLAALTNRQNYALTNLSITKQAEQSLLQLLR